MTLAQETHDSLVGQEVGLAGATGPFRRCSECGGALGWIGKGHGPHAASLACAACNHHISWLGAAHLDALAALVRARVA